MARELMAITGMTAKELVHLARAAFGAVSACNNAARAAVLGIFSRDGITGDGRGLCLLGSPPSPQLIYIPTHKYNRVYLYMRIYVHHSLLYICTLIHLYILR